MPWSPSTPVTGGAQTGLTSPTYTLSSDTFPDTNGKQHSVSALGGTQAGVRTHSGSQYFTLAGYKPKTYKVMGPISNGGVLSGNNTFGVIARTMVYPAGVANTSVAGKPAIVRFEISVPSGAEVNDAPQVRALLSAAIGALWAQSSNFGDMAITNTL